MRDLGEAAASRVRVAVAARDVHSAGGLVRTSRPRKQRQQLAEATYGLLHAAALFELPLIVLEYPRFAKDAGYAYRRLRVVLGDLSEEDFAAAWKEVVDPSLVRSAPVTVPRLADARLAFLRCRRAVNRYLKIR